MPTAAPDKTEGDHPTLRSLMRVQLAWTMLAELAVMVSGVVLLKMAAQFLGPVGFGEYTLSRRAVGLLSLPLLMGARDCRAALHCDRECRCAAPLLRAIVRVGRIDCWYGSFRLLLYCY